MSPLFYRDGKVVSLGQIAEWRRPDGFRPCTWQVCTNEATTRYNLPFCQEHVLHVWALVDEDLRGGANLEALVNEACPPKPAPVARGVIYFLHVGEYIKIGYTSDLVRRLREYPPNADLLAYHFGTIDDEKALHRRFRVFCEAGREWYRDVPTIRAHIEGVVAEHGDHLEPGRERSRKASAPRLRSKTSRAARSVIL